MVCVCQQQQQQQQQQWCYPVAAPLLAQKLNATDPPRPTDNTLLYIFPDAIASSKLKYTLSLKHTHAAASRLPNNALPSFDQPENTRLFAAFMRAPLKLK
jgi:hypothetical protein